MPARSCELSRPTIATMQDHGAQEYPKCNWLWQVLEYVTKVFRISTDPQLLATSRYGKDPSASLNPEAAKLLASDVDM